MIQAWWAAHELELYVSGFILGVPLLIAACEATADIWRERKRKREAGIL